MLQITPPLQGGVIAKQPATAPFTLSVFEERSIHRFATPSSAIKIYQCETGNKGRTPGAQKDVLYSFSGEQATKAGVLRNSEFHFADPVRWWSQKPISKKIPFENSRTHSKLFANFLGTKILAEAHLRSLNLFLGF